METKRNLKYFTAPPFSILTIVGLALAVIGVVFATLRGFRGMGMRMAGIIMAIIGAAIAILASGGKSTDSDIDYQVAERVKNLQELNEKKHEVYEKAFLKQRKPIDLKGFEFEPKESEFYYKKGPDGVGRTCYYKAVNLIFTGEKMFMLGRRFSLLDESIDEEIEGNYFYNELSKATVEEKEYEYKDGKRNMKAKYALFQILDDKGEPVLKICVNVGADIDTYTDQITRVIATRQRELAKRAEETAQRRADFRAKVAAEKDAEAAAIAAGKSPEEVEAAIKAASQAYEDEKNRIKQEAIEMERNTRRKTIKE